MKLKIEPRPDGWSRGYFCAVAAYLKENCASGVSNTEADSLFRAGGDWRKADPQDIETFRQHGLIWLPRAHDHSCGCGAADAPHPHNIGEHGCVRFMVEAPKKVSGDHPALWDAGDPDGQPITDYTLRHQRGYAQHPCGCWSRWPWSSNSVEA